MIKQIKVLTNTFSLFFVLVLFEANVEAATIEDLEENIRLLQAQLQEMKEKLDTVEAKHEVRQQFTPELTHTQPETPAEKIKVTTKGGIKVESEDGDFSAQVGGRILTDFAWYDEDKSNLGDGTKFRATRLYLAGTLFKDWKFKGQYDFADNKAKAKDVYISYTGYKPFYIKAGHYKPPFSMEQLTSIRFVSFLERGLLDNFVPGRLLGLSIGTSGKNWGAALGAFGSTASGDASLEGDENWSAIGRFTYAPINTSTSLLHLGLSGRYLSVEDETVRFRAKPNSNVTDVRFVDTGVLSNVDSTLSLNAEIAAMYGPFSIQSQYVNVDVDRESQYSDPDFEGWYVYGSYFLTGESRNYDVKNGAFGRITPHDNFSLHSKGWGAWELITRFDSIDLNDEDVFGGREKNITLGLNWYPNPHIKVMTNYTWVNNDEFAVGNSSNLKSGEVSAGNDDPNIFQIRLQADF